MKLTRHNGRSGKHGTYNPRHNDRRFDVENSEHIDAERARQNVDVYKRQDESWYDSFYRCLRMEMDEYYQLKYRLRVLQANTDYEEELYDEAV